MKKPVVTKFWSRAFLRKVWSLTVIVSGWKLVCVPRQPTCQPIPNAFQNGMAQLRYSLVPKLPWRPRLVSLVKAVTPALAVKSRYHRQP